MPEPTLKRRVRHGIILCAASLCVAASSQLSPKRIPFADVLTSVQRSLLTQIELGKLGRDRGQTELARAYGDRLARDNQLGLRLLTTIADDMKVAFGPLIPEAPHEKIVWERAQAMKKELADLPSPDFDLAYLRAMEASERDAVNTLSDAIGNLPVSQARELIQRLRPISQQHQELASRLGKKIG